MSKNFIVLIVLSMSLNGCFIADEFLEAPKAEPERSLQERVQDSVYLDLKNNSGMEYEPYGFSELKIVKPVQLIELEDLEEKRKTGTDTITIDRQIDSLNSVIEKNDISSKIKIEHFFTLKDSLSGFTILETEFTLNDQLKIVSTKPEIILESVSRFEEILPYYFWEYTIFLAESYEKSKKLSKEFFQFFKNEIETLESSKRKSEFLEHVLDLCRAVKATGRFDQDIILQAIVRTYMLEERKDIADYASISFSDLYSREHEESSTDEDGYYFFHKFSGSFAEKFDTSVVLVEFTSHYEIDNIYQMEPPFDQYFNKKL